MSEVVKVLALLVAFECARFLAREASRWWTERRFARSARLDWSKLSTVERARLNRAMRPARRGACYHAPEEHEPADWPGGPRPCAICACRGECMETSEGAPA